MHKYIYKKENRTTLKFANDQNEISRYLNGRYINPCQTAWNLFEYRNHTEDPPVTHLALHFPNQQRVHFRENTADLAQALDNADTTFTCFLRYNADNTDGRDFLYHVSRFELNFLTS